MLAVCNVDCHGIILGTSWVFIFTVVCVALALVTFQAASRWLY